MLINGDVKGLELHVAADWYKDKLLTEELTSGFDLHAANQLRFKLPSRTIAKIFVFKLLYGASAYGYSVDSDFMNVGYDQKDWQNVIDEFYNKYTGIKAGHERDIALVQKQRYLEIPSGRYFNYVPTLRNGQYKWPITTIKNYPIQGFGADLVALARVAAWKRFTSEIPTGSFICTVHDSLVFDVPSKYIEPTARIINDAVRSIPRLCKETFEYEFTLPISCEVSIGKNKLDMEVISC